MASTGRVLGGAGSGAATGTAILPGWGTAIGAVAGGVMGAMSGDDGSGAASDAIQKAIAEYENMGLPPDESIPIIYQQLHQGGQLTPQLEGLLQEEMVQTAQAKDNNETRAQMTSALQGIRSKAFGGLSPEQMANQQRLLQQVDAGTQAKFKGILQGQAAQGKAGSGDALAAMLNAGQGGAQQGSQNALEIGAQGSRAQDAALRDYLSGIGNLRAADTSREEYNAGARNTANLAKLANASSRQARNVSSANQANQYNLGRQNQVNDANTIQANQEKLRQRDAERQYWIDKLALASGKANAYTGQANMLTNQAANSNQNFNNAMQGVNAAGVAYGQYQNNQKQNQLYADRTNALSGGQHQQQQNYSNPYSYQDTSSFTPNTNAGSQYSGGAAIPQNNYYGYGGAPSNNDNNSDWHQYFNQQNYAGY